MSLLGHDAPSDALPQFHLPLDGDEAQFVFDMTRSEEAAIEFLQGRRCLRSAAVCRWAVEGKGRCGRPMSVHRDKQRRPMQLRCLSHRQHKISVKSGSFFAKLSMPLSQMLRVLFCWARKCNGGDVSEQLNLSPITVYRQYERLRNHCAEWLRKHPQRLGGEGKTVCVEYFEYRVDPRIPINERLVGMLCPEDGKTFFTLTDDLSSENLCSLVAANAAEGSTVVSESWRDVASVCDIAGLSFLTGSCSQARADLVKASWKTFKSRLDKNQCGPRGKTNGYYMEQLWRDRYAEGCNAKQIFDTLLQQFAQESDFNADAGLLPEQHSGLRQNVAEEGSRDSQTSPDGEGRDPSESTSEGQSIPRNLPSTPISSASLSSNNSDSPDKLCLEPEVKLKVGGELDVREKSFDNSKATQIVWLNEILSNDAILDEGVNLGELYQALDSQVSALRWCARRRLIRNDACCEVCQQPMTLLPAPKLAHELILSDGFFWFCKSHLTRRSIRKDSVFEGIPLTIKQSVSFIYAWAKEFPEELLAHEAKIASRQMVLEMASRCRSICQLWLKKNQCKIGGIDPVSGGPVVVELRRHFFKRDKKVGGKKRMLLSGVEVATGQFFVADVADERPKTLEAALVAHVHAGTNVVTDGDWGGCRVDFRANGLIHQVRAESDDGAETFDDGTGLWARVRQALTRASSDEKNSYLQFFVYQWMFLNITKLRGQGMFEAFILAIQESYPNAAHVGELERPTSLLFALECQKSLENDRQNAISNADSMPGETGSSLDSTRKRRSAKSSAGHASSSKRALKPTGQRSGSIRVMKHQRGAFVGVAQNGPVAVQLASTNVDGVAQGQVDGSDLGLSCGEAFGHPPVKTFRIEGCDDTAANRPQLEEEKDSVCQYPPIVKEEVGPEERIMVYLQS